MFNDTTPAIWQSHFQQPIRTYYMAEGSNLMAILLALFLAFSFPRHNLLSTVLFGSSFSRNKWFFFFFLHRTFKWMNKQDKRESERVL